MTIRFEVPCVDGQAVVFDLGNGQTLYVLGANGSGKSTLLGRWKIAHDDATFITGNREIVFGAAQISIAAQNASRHEQIAANELKNARSRFTRVRTH